MMFCYYLDGQWVGTFSYKEAALLMVQVHRYQELGPGPWCPGTFDGTQRVVTPNGEELDLMHELNQIPPLLPITPRRGPNG